MILFILVLTRIEENLNIESFTWLWDIRYLVSREIFVNPSFLRRFRIISFFYISHLEKTDNQDQISHERTFIGGNSPTFVPPQEAKTQLGFKFLLLQLISSSDNLFLRNPVEINGLLSDSTLDNCFFTYVSSVSWLKLTYQKSMRFEEETKNIFTEGKIIWGSKNIYNYIFT